MSKHMEPLEMLCAVSLMNTVDDVLQSNLVPEIAKHIVEKQMQRNKREMEKLVDKCTELEEFAKTETERAFQYQKRFSKLHQELQLTQTHLALTQGQPVASRDLELYNLFKGTAALPACCR